jgi:hypothetical protein
MMARFTIDQFGGATCSCSYDGWTYVGSKNGIVYRTIDGISYDEFLRTYSPMVSSLHVFGNALFIGTSPNGVILIHNFSTGNRFVYVQTGDYSISSIVDDGDTMYASTSPSGMILSFNGYEWKKIYESFTDISSLCYYSGGIYAFSRDDGTVRVRSENAWSFMKDDGVIFVVGKKNFVSSKSEIPGNPHFEIGVGTSTSVGGKMYFSGVKNPVVYSYNGSKVSVEYRFSGGTISSMSSSVDQLFIAVGPDLYVHQVGDDAEVKSVDNTNS